MRTSCRDDAAEDFMTRPFSCEVCHALAEDVLWLLGEDLIISVHVDVIPSKKSVLGSISLIRLHVGFVISSITLRTFLCFHSGLQLERFCWKLPLVEGEGERFCREKKSRSEFGKGFGSRFGRGRTRRDGCAMAGRWGSGRRFRASEKYGKVWKSGFRHARFLGRPIHL